jgi:pseudouridine-5'-phosphate glycosidase
MILDYFSISKDIEEALKHNLPIVALESAVITHGLPEPINYELAIEMESNVRLNGGIPATIAVMNGRIKIGLSAEELKELSQTNDSIKVSPRNFAIAIHKNINGGTTVAGTILAANQAGIEVFATGGIGGVHRNSNFDISADLPILGQKRMVVVCAGAKAILDIPATLEVLETYGVPVIGYQTSEFPAFYSRKSGFKVDYRANDIQEIAHLIRTHWGCGNNTSILIAVPIPIDFEIDSAVIESALDRALKDAKNNQIHGSEATPFLLKKMNEFTKGKSLQANLALLKNNAKVAAEIAIGLKV